MSVIYLDNSATTKPSEEAISAALSVLSSEYGNPSSVHSMGKNAADILNSARNSLLRALLGDEISSRLPKSSALSPVAPQPYGRLIFTGSGTEADNLAIFGVTQHYLKNAEKYKLITTDSEHPAVREPYEYLKSLGFQTVYIGTKNGILDMEQLKSELTPNTLLLSLMLANNETGAIYDVKTAFSLAHEISKDVICHTDAVQAFQKTPFTASSIGADMISVSAHKVHAPKGVGALWISCELARRSRIRPHILGGGQEYALRSGTENLPGIAAFAAAVDANGGASAGKAFTERCARLRCVLRDALPNGVRENIPEGDYLPHIASLTLPIPRSQPMLNYLSSRGIYISAGSACSARKPTVSAPLLAFGLSSSDAAATVRVSFDASTTDDELTEFCNVLGEGLATLYGKKQQTPIR